MDRRENRNKWLMYAENVLYNVALLVGNGTIFHSFLSYAGVSSEKIGLYSTVAQITQAAIMFFSSAFLDKVRNIRKMYFFTVLLEALYYAAMVFLCRDSAVAGSSFFTVVMLSSVLLNLLLGLRSVIAYKIPYLLIDMSTYGRQCVMQCILLSVAGILFSAAASKAFEMYAFLPVMRVLLILGIFLVVGTAFIISLYHTDEPKEKTENAPKYSVIRLFKDKRFYAYVLPNLLRGAAGGILSMIVILAKQDITADEAFMSKFVVAAQASALISYGLYRLLIKKLSAKSLNMIGSVIFALMPVMGLTHNSTLYMAAYFAVNIGLGFFSVAIPVIVAQNIEYEIAGGYNSWRMLFNSAGTAMGTYACGMLVGKVPSLSLFIAAAVMQMICAVAYMYFEKPRKAQ